MARTIFVYGGTIQLRSRHKMVTVINKAEESPINLEMYRREANKISDIAYPNGK